MRKISRRLFIKSLSTAAALTGSGLLQRAVAADESLPQVTLGAAKIKTSMLAFGTGSSGWMHCSNQTRLGLDTFLQVARHAHDSGITFYDTADIYGSHTFAGEALKKVPREKVTVLKQAHDNGKSILGCKIFGCGSLVAEEERKQSLQYVLHSKNIDAMTIGFESPQQIDDAIARIKRIVKQV